VSSLATALTAVPHDGQIRFDSGTAEWQVWHVIIRCIPLWLPQLYQIAFDSMESHRDD
jgi:hypothetical protein